MSHLYLLDTNIISDLVRNPRGKVFKRIKQVGESAICTSIIVAAELRFGAQKSDSVALTRRIEELLGRIEILALDEPADQHYGVLRRVLEKQGNMIGPNDFLIAAHGLSLGLTVVTHNLSEFQRVPNLQVENWLI